MSVEAERPRWTRQRRQIIYRPEPDCLSALAILPVVLFGCRKTVVGVEMFFVIIICP